MMTCCTFVYSVINLIQTKQYVFLIDCLCSGPQPGTRFTKKVYTKSDSIRYLIFKFFLTGIEPRAPVKRRSDSRQHAHRNRFHRFFVVRVGTGNRRRRRSGKTEDFRRSWSVGRKRHRRGKAPFTRPTKLVRFCRPVRFRFGGKGL